MVNNFSVLVFGKACTAPAIEVGANHFLIRVHFGNPTRERGTASRLIVPRSRVLELRFLVWCLFVGRTEAAIRAGTAQTPPLCRRDYPINDVSTCVRSSGNGSVCSVRPTPG